MGSPVVLVDQYGLPTQGGAYTLASNAALGATTGSATAVGIIGGSYIFSAIFTGTSVALQTLGADATTWVALSPPAVLTSSGSVGVVIGNNAAVRLYNPNASGLTGLYATIS